jgi:hypothetical protein
MIPIGPEAVQKCGSTSSLVPIEFLQVGIRGNDLEIGPVPGYSLRVIQGGTFVVRRLTIGNAGGEAGAGQLQQAQSTVAIGREIALERGRSGFG